MMRNIILVVPFLLAMASTLATQPLYLGNEEVDTADSDAIAAVIRHCTELANSEAGDDPTLDALTQRPEPDHYARPITIDALASSGDDTEAAGEGAGTGMPANGLKNRPEDAAPALQEITSEMCKEAGILF